MKFEASIIEFLQGNIGAGWITVFQIITMLGSYLGIFITFLILFIKNKKLSAVFLVTVVFALIFNSLLKMIVCRNRPFDDYSTILNYGNEDGYSFPSGHCVCAGVISMFLFYSILTSTKRMSTKILAGIDGLLFCLLIALSRMVLGVHYLTDTLAGIIIGIIFAIGIILLYNMLRKKSKRLNKLSD